jgi:hypothetical protein
LFVSWLRQPLGHDPKAAQVTPHKKLRRQPTMEEPMVKILDLAFQDLDKPGLKYLQGARKDGRVVEAKHDDDILKVAQKIAEKKADYVIVLGEKEEDIRGLLTESFVNDQLSLSKQRTAPNFSDALLKLAQAAHVNRLEFPARIRPKLFYCEKGKHYTTKNPCPAHP